jgi:hypothetical protein
MKKPDFIFSDEGSIIFLHPLSKQARKWCERLKLATWMSPVCLEIEAGMFEDIKEGIINEGLIIEKY